MPAKGTKKPSPPRQEMAQVNKNADPKKKNFYEQYSGMVAPGSSSQSPAHPDNDSDNDSDPDFHNDGAGLLLNPPTNAPLPSSKGKANVDSDDDEEEEFNAETMLYAAADDVYFSTKRKRSLASMKTTFMKGSGSSGIRATNTPGRDKERNIFRRVKGWYSPMYDYRSPNMTEEERRKPRYCGAALKRWQFVLVHFAAVLGLVMLVMIPLAYFVIIPKIIQDTIDQTGTDSVTLSNLDVDHFDASKVGFYVKAQIPPPTIFPLRAGVGDLTLKINDEKENTLMEALIPGLDFTLNQVVKFETRANVSFANSNFDALAQLVKDFSTKGLNDRVFMMRAKVQVKVFGITVYAALPIHKAFPITGITNNVVKLYGSLPGFARVPANEMNLLQNAYADNPDQIITFTNSTLFPPIALKTFTVAATDIGLDLTVGIEFQNPTRITLANFESAEFGVMIEGASLARVEVVNLSLKSQLQTLDLKASIKFDTKDPAAIAKAFRSAVEKVLKGKERELVMAVVGPLSLTQVGVVQTFTKDFLVYLPGADVVNSLNTDAVRNLLTPTGIASIIGNSTLSATVDSTQISVTADVGIPKFFPLPPTISFPHNTTIGVYGGLQKIFVIDMGAVTIQTTKSRIGLQTSINMRLENSTEAADALAGIVNPLLAATPSDSEVSFGDIAILKTGRTPYEWTKKLFDGNVLSITVPGGIITTPGIIDILTQNMTTLPIDIKRMDVSQLKDVAGFGAIGNVGMKLPPNLAELASSASVNVDIGYAGAQILVEKASIAVAELGSGLKIPAADGTNGTNIDARVVLAPKSDTFTNAVQRLLNAVIATLEGKQADDSAIGITGLNFGTSRATSFVTFSRVVAEISSGQVLPLLNRTVEGLKKTILVPGTVRVENMGLGVETATKAKVDVGVQIKNPTPVTISVGSVSAGVALDGVRVGSGSLTPLRLGAGLGRLDVTADVTLSDGSNGAGDEVAQLVKAFLATPVAFGDAPVVSLGGLVLVEAGSPAATIDHLSNVTISVPVSLLSSVLPTSFTEGKGGIFAFDSTSWLDLSPVLPTPDTLSKFNISIKTVDFEVLPNSEIVMAVSADYFNPLGVGASLPYGGASVGLMEDPAAVITGTVTALRVTPGSGSMSPTIRVKIPKNVVALHDAISVLVNAVLETGKIPVDFKIPTGSLVYGGSATDMSALLSKVTLDLATFLKDVNLGDIISSIINRVLPFPLPASLDDLSSFAQSALNTASGTIRVSTLPKKSFEIVVPEIRIRLPFGVNGNVGYASFALGVNGRPLVEVLAERGVRMSVEGEMTRIVVPGVVAGFTDEEVTREDVAKIFKAFLEGTDFGGAKVNLERVILGASPSDTVTALSTVNVGLKIDSILKPTKPTDLASLLSSFQAALTGEVGITALSNQRLGIATNIGFKLPFAIEANIGYIGANVGLDSNPLAVFALPTGVKVQAGSLGTTNLNLDTTLQLTDNDGTRTAVAGLVDRLLGGQKLGSTLDLGALKIGASESDVLTILEKINLPLGLDAAVQLLLGTSSDKIFDLKTILKDFNPSIGATTVMVKPEKVLAVDTGVEFNLNLPIKISFKAGHLAAQTGIKGNALASFALPGVEISNTGNARTSIKVQTDVKFNDNDATQTALANVVENFMKGGKLDSTLDLTNVAVGASTSDTLTVLSKVNVKLDLDMVVDAVYPRTGPIDAITLLRDLKPAITGAVDLTTLANQQLGVSVAAALTLPFRITATLGYLSTSLGLNSHPLGEFALPGGLSIASTENGQTPIKVDTALRFTDDDATRDAVATIVDRFTSNKKLESTVNIAGIMIGVNANDAITAFRKVSVPVDIDAAIALVLGSDVLLDIPGILKSLNPTIGTTTIQSRAQKKLRVATSAEFTLNLPLKISLRLGYFSGAAGIGGNPLAEFALPDLALSTADEERERVAVDTELAFVDGEGLQDELARIVDKFIKGSKLESHAGIGSIRIGASASDTLSVFSKVNVKVDLDMVVDALYPRKGPIDVGQLAADFISGLLSNSTSAIALKKATIAAVAGDKIDASLSAILLKQPLPFQIIAELGYVNVAQILVDEIRAMATDLLEVALDRNGDAKLKAEIRVTDSKDLEEKIRKIFEEYRSKGQIPTVLRMAGIVFGQSSSDYLTFLSKTSIPINLNPIVKIVEEFATKFIDTLLANIPGGQLGDIAKGGPITIDLGQGIAVTLNTVSAAFAANDNINLRVEAGLKFPFAIDASIPFLTVDIGLDDVRAISTRINGLNVVGGGTSSLNLGSGVQVHDSDRLADTVAAIAAAFFSASNLPGNLVISGASLGPSADDAITAFSGASIPLSLNRLAEPFLKGVDRNIDVIAILERFGLKIGNVNVRTVAGRAIDAGLSAGINNIFPLAADVPYLALNVGLDEVDIATASVLDTKIAPAAQNLDVKAKIAFPSSKQIQDKVAAFASKLLKDGYGSTSESIAASGIVFGVSKEDSITALSKARVLLPSKSLITEKNVEVLLGLIGLKAGDLTLDGLLKRLDVRGVNLDASMEGKVRVDAAVGLKGLNLAATADLGFAGLTATLDSTRLADAAIPSGISVRTIDGSVVLNLGVDLFLGSGDTLQTAIAKLIETFADSKPTTFTSIGGASKVVFGVSATDYIDTLSGAALELNLDPFLQPAKKMVFEIIDGVIAGTSAYKLALNNVDVFWSSTKAIGSALSAAIGGLPGNITAKVPFLGLKAKVNGQDFILPVVNDFTFQNGVATAKADIGFIENDPLAQQLWILVGNVVFHRAGPTNLFVTGYGVMFGSSASKAYDLASKASINIYLDSFVKTVFDYFDKQRPVELKDIQAQILNEGIRTNIICSQLPDWLPVNVKLGTVVGQVTWRINGVQEPAFRIVDAIFTNIQVTPGKPITFDLLMSPDPSKETGFLKPLEEAIPFLVQFKDYAQFAYLGRVDVYEKGIEKGNSFNIFGRSEFEAPDLYLWQPITIKPLISNPFTRKGLQFKIEVFWPNPGPLHLDVGVLSVRLESEGDPLLTIESPGPVIVKNVNEGANENQGRQGLVNGVLAITIRWSNFNPLTFFENLFDLLNPAENFKLIIETIRPSEGPIKWLNIGLEQLPRDIIENLLPTVIALLGNVKLEIFGFSLSASLIPGFNKFLRAAKAKIEQYPAQHWNFVEEL